jgi:hypothetical protein
MNHEEFSMCTQIVKWSDQWFCAFHPELLVQQYDKKGNPQRKISPLVHVKNEGKSSAKLGRQANLMGRRKGFVDYLYPVPRKGYGGLYIEVKKPGGNVKDVNQNEWLEFLIRFNMCVVVDCVAGFKHVVEEYFS